MSKFRFYWFQCACVVLGLEFTFGAVGRKEGRNEMRRGLYYNHLHRIITKTTCEKHFKIAIQML